MVEIPPLCFDRSQDAQLVRRICEVITSALNAPTQPSPHELVERVHEQVGSVAHWEIVPSLRVMAKDKVLPRLHRSYIESILNNGELVGALVGTSAPRKEIASSFDQLIHRSKSYRSSAGFREMIDFMARFQEYAPYNNMLVRLQNPACSFFATEMDWRRRFGRTIKEDARPMVILAPMSPLICVYDISQTEGKPMPAELRSFSQFEGVAAPDVLEHLITNAARHDAIRVDVKDLSTTLSGFATHVRGVSQWKMRIVVHEGLNTASRLGVLCHELAHIYLGHLGSDADHWWPVRSNLDRHSVEIEAEATAHLVTARLGLKGASHEYVSRYLKDGELPGGVSLDLIAKVAGRIEQMMHKRLSERTPGTPKK